MRHETRPERFCFAARRAGHRPACRDGRRARLRPVRGTLRGHLREHGGIGRLPRSALHPQPRLPELRRQAAPPLPTGWRLLYRPWTTGDRRAPPLLPRRVGAAGPPLPRPAAVAGCRRRARGRPRLRHVRRLHGHRHRGGRLEPPRRGGEEGIARGACASSSPTRAAAFPPPTSPTSTRASGGRTRAVPSPGTGSDSPSSRPSSRRTAAASTATRSPAKAAPSRSSSRQTGREDDRRGLSSWPVPAGSRPSDGRRRGTSRAPARFR